MKITNNKLFIFTEGFDNVTNSVIVLDNKIKLHFKDMCEYSMTKILDFNQKHYSEPVTKYKDCVIQFKTNMTEILGWKSNPGIYTNDRKRLFENVSGYFLLSQVIQFCHDVYNFNNFYISVCALTKNKQEETIRIFAPININDDKSVHIYKYVKKMTKKKKQYMKKMNNKSRKEKKNHI
jgi:hypothetical protein